MKNGVVARFVAEAQSHDEEDHLSHVRAEKVVNKPLDVVKYASTLPGARHD